MSCRVHQTREIEANDMAKEEWRHRALQARFDATRCRYPTPEAWSAETHLRSMGDSAPSVRPSDARLSGGKIWARPFPFLGLSGVSFSVSNSYVTLRAVLTAVEFFVSIPNPV